jgi:hypothetical protein
MFDQLDDQNNATRESQNSLPNYWVHACLIFLAFALSGTYFAISNYYYAKKDAEIAPRQQSTLGVITYVVRGKGSIYYFKFSYKNHTYDNSERGGFDLSEGDQVTVYFDPINPKSSSMTDFYELSAMHNQQWQRSLGGSFAFLAVTAFCWTQSIARKREIEQLTLKSANEPFFRLKK